MVIGGGIAGLTCAVGLSLHGVAVTLLESEGILGGRACSWRDDVTGDAVDLGPHVFLSEYRNMLKFLEILGTGDQICWRMDGLLTLSAPDYRTVIRVHPLPPPAHLLPSMLAAPGLDLRDILSNIPLSHRVATMTEEDLQRLDGRTAMDFLRQMKVSRHFIEWFWAATSMAIMNVPLEECSAGALMRFYLNVMARNRLRMGFARCGLGDLFTGPAERIVKGAGGDVRRHTMAEAVETDAGGLSVRVAGGGRFRARHCVIALPPERTAALLPEGITEPDPADLRRFRPSPYISSYLWFDRKLTDEMAWLRLWRPENLNYDFYALSNIREGWGGRGSLIAGNIIYSHRAEGLSDERILERTLSEIAELAPEVKNARLLHHRIHRIPMAIPCPYPGTERLRPPTATALPGLYLAGDWTRTGLPSSMESAARSGWLAAEAVLRDRGVEASLALPARRTWGVIGAARALLGRPLRIPPAA